MRQDHFFVKVKNVYRRIPVGSIVYLESGGNEVRLVLGNESVIIRGSLVKVLAMLPEESFCRIHESYGVAVDKIVLFSSESVCMQLRKQRVELPIGRHHKKLLEEKIWVLGEKVTTITK
ncbi:MAG: LytTR family DNA-binding domain-containing protein [Bacteroidota bacterium]